MHRITWGLTLSDMARLLGLKDKRQAQRVERGERRPQLETALACAALFGVPLAELFPQLTREIEERIRVRLAAFRKGLGQPSTASALRKRALVDRALGDRKGCEATTEV